MGRRSSAVARAAALLAVFIGAHVAGNAVAAVPATFAAPDVLEPAKSALRLKQFADAAGRLGADPLAADPRAQYLLGTLYLAGLGVSEDTQRARTLFTAAAAKGEPRAAYALAALAAHDSPAKESEAQTWLAKAAAAGHADAARLLQAGELPLQADPLVLATEPAVTLSMTIAAARGADVDTMARLWPLLPKDASDAFQRTPLHHAAESGAAESVRWLVTHGARVDAIDAQGITPLMLAATAERGDALDVLLQAKPHVAAVDALGNSALFYAARRGRIAQVERLVAAGVDPKVRNAGGWSAVDYSVQSRQDAVTGYLVQQGAHPARSHSAGAQSRLDAGWSSSSLCAGDAYAGWPDVALAASRSDPAMLKSVLARGGNPDATTAAGQPALHVAIAASSPASVGVLLAAGASPTRPDRAGHTPLGVAVSQGSKDIVRMLLERGRQSERACRQRNARLSLLRCAGVMRTSCRCCWRAEPKPIPARATRRRWSSRRCEAMRPLCHCCCERVLGLKRQMPPDTPRCGTRRVATTPPSSRCCWLLEPT